MSSNVHNKTSGGKILPWIVWGLGCLFYFYEFLLQVSPSVMGNELMRDFGITSQMLGLLSGMYYYAYFPMQLPVGVLIDTYGPRILLTIATAICAVATLIFAITDNLTIACVARLMIGFGSAFAAVGTMKLAANWFAAEKFAFLTGLMVTIGMLGAIGGEAPLAMLIDHFGWRETLLILGFIGIFLAFLIFFVSRDVPKGSLKYPENLSQAEEEHLWANLLILLKNNQLRLIAIYGGLMYMSTPVFCGLWGVPFLMLKLGITKAVAAKYVSLVFFGWAVSGPLWGIFSNKLGLRKPSLYIASVGSLILSLLFIYAPITSGALMQALLFAFGITSAAFLPSFAVAKELCSRKYVATGLGFMNMVNMIGIAIAQPLIGYILDIYWQGGIAEDGVRIYTLDAYHIALAILPFGIFMSLVLLPLLRETYCKNIHEEEVVANT